MFYRYTTKCIIAKNFPLPTLQTLQKNKWHESPWSLIGLIDKYYYTILFIKCEISAKIVKLFSEGWEISISWQNYYF